MSLGEMETTPAALRWSFPPPICSSRSMFRGFSDYGRLLAKLLGGLFLESFLGQDGVMGEKIDGKGDTRLQKVGPTRPDRKSVV